jgi:hypothetical protein
MASSGLFDGLLAMAEVFASTARKSVEESTHRVSARAGAGL